MVGFIMNDGTDDSVYKSEFRTPGTPLRLSDKISPSAMVF